MRWFSIPLPKSYDLDQQNTVHLGPDWSIIAPPEAEKIAAQYIEMFSLSKTAVPKQLVLTLVDMEHDGFSICTQPARITISGGSVSALRHAMYSLYQLEQNRALPLGTITDYPLLSMRGFHLNLHTLRHMNIDELCSVLKWMAEGKLNTVLIEYDHHFPFQKYPDSRSYDALTKDELGRLVATAMDYGLEVIPLFQSFGHLGNVLNNPALSDIRESAHGGQQICPQNPKSLAFIIDMLDEFIEMHPGIRYIHIGGDETRELGHCPKCREFVARHGKGMLYTAFINQIIDEVCRRGLTPLLYDDMLCAHPDALEALDRRAVIVYWDYWAVEQHIPYMIARYDRGEKPVTICDRRWMDGTWTNELTDVERGILQHFAQGVDLPDDLSPAFLARYGAYLGDSFPKRIRAYPYLEYYMEKGFRVIGMPTCLGNTDHYKGMPNQARFIANTRVCCERMAEAGALGVITSAWYPYPSSMYPVGVSTTAQFTWGLPDWYAHDDVTLSPKANK